MTHLPFRPLRPIDYEMSMGKKNCVSGVVTAESWNEVMWQKLWEAAYLEAGREGEMVGNKLSNGGARGGDEKGW